MKRILFFTFLTVFLISFAILGHQKDDNEIIKEKLLEFGYPAKGYVIINNTIRYSDGSFVVLSTPPKKYPITAIGAYNLAKKYLDEKYNKMLEEHNYYLDVEPGSIREYEKDGNYYWQFKLLFGKKGTKGDFMGYVLVNRKTGSVKIKGLFG
ncbi:hypothetical protein [Methanotorris igneus]|uniref:Uncharacterized protein n=1 Tax=Methanotorris igneus (strain DSM 5666 / JCM 11834 / Kol 5) TaxID=880724 RepID=F6BBP9_METIK|nr:hypothetical protein [Methanotorris igneus]AEF96058.1 hypothetical protein Metig_0502 [Methanotorris igneus Kol 5]